ncbi:MAG TPA: hypothetical protein PKM73_21640 [Verrucomicrobiota bacterium]|nr:hypothetical protein [Verrucomicrobiota bacterium]HNU52358.1 hypothetical protein [Verrucomicrobiota bacterium]
MTAMTFRQENEKTIVTPRSASLAGFLLLLSASLSGPGALGAGQSSTPQSARPSTPVTAPSIVEAGPHHRVWRWQVSGKSGAGGEVESLIELGTGLNRWDARRGDWVPAAATFKRTAGGHFVGRETQHQVIIAPDLATEGAIDLQTPGGSRLRSTVLGIALADPETGEAVLIGETRSCSGTLVGSTQVLFRDAFDGLDADLRYQISKHGFEQDVILRKPIAAEQVRGLGLDPDRCRLLVLTEFFESPAPLRLRSALRRGSSSGPPMVDEDLEFDDMRVGRGRAFRLQDGGPELPIAKSWETLENRQFLIESLAFSEVQVLQERAFPGRRFGISEPLEELRRLAPETPPRPVQYRLARLLPRRPLPKAPPLESSPHAIRTDPVEVRPRPSPSFPSAVEDSTLAKRGSDLMSADAPSLALVHAGSGVVLDYAMTIIPARLEQRFLARTTYYISSAYVCSGPVFLEGGAVIKFTNSQAARLICPYAVTCLTGPYNPAIFTSKDDNSVGAIIPGSTGVPARAGGPQPALEIHQPGQALHDVRIRFANTGVAWRASGTGTSTLRHAQILECGTALQVEGTDTAFHQLELENVLIHDSDIAVSGQCYEVRGRHLTLHQCGLLAEETATGEPEGPCHLALVNSLLVAVGQAGSLPHTTTTACATRSSDAGVFRAVGDAHFYLADPALRDAGSRDLPSDLLEALAARTTYPPVRLAGNLRGNVRLRPQAARDSGAPDLGFHYDPIDYLLASAVVPAGGTLQIAPGTAVVCSAPFGLRADPGSRLLALGTALDPVHFALPAAVQEHAGASNPSGAETVALCGPPGSTSAIPPELELRFARFHGLGGAGLAIAFDGSASTVFRVLAEHCRFEQGRFALAGASAAQFTLHNNLFIDAAWRCAQSPQLTARNNLFHRGSATFERASSAGAWVLRDNLFHDTTVTDALGGLSHSHNAYIGPNTAQLKGATTKNIVMTEFFYRTGPAGGYYQATAGLANAGSHSAADAGLYHFTAADPYIPEQNTIVDIGFHLPACTRATATAPEQFSDTDQDGVPDLAEDADGDGLSGSGETHWQDPTDPGLEIRISRPLQSGWLP